MIKINQTNEIEMLINVIKNNVLNTFNLWEVIMKYKKKPMTPKIEKEFIVAYKLLGVEMPNFYISSSELYEMPYNKNITLDVFKDIEQNIEFKQYNLKKGCIEPTDFGNKDKYLKNYTTMAYYNKDIRATMIVENNETWMSPTLTERNTMITPIEKASGHVLTFGLGIGYFPYNCILKDDVKSVTIVERNQDIINLFKEKILPQFNTDKSINIVHGDLFDYYNDEFMEDFDYIFVDIWKNETDGLTIYEQMMKIDVKKDGIDYWIEDAILYTLQQMTFVYLKAVFDGRLTEKLTEFQDEESKHLMKMIHKYFRAVDETISTKEQLLFYLNDTTVLRSILRN